MTASFLNAPQRAARVLIGPIGAAGCDVPGSSGSAWAVGSLSLFWFDFLILMRLNLVQIKRANHTCVLSRRYVLRKI